MKRTETRSIQVRDITIGGQNKVVIQSMCNTRTSDIEATMAQILQLEQVGCELVRMAIIDEADAAAITEIRKRTHIPLSLIHIYRTVHNNRSLIGEVQHRVLQHRHIQLIDCLLYTSRCV